MFHFSGPKEVVQQLIANGADINGTDDKKRWTPLKVATTFGNFEYLYLERRSFDFHSLISHFSGQKEIVQLLIDYGADINFSDIEGNTALHQAAHYGNFKYLCFGINSIHLDLLIVVLFFRSQGNCANSHR